MSGKRTKTEFPEYDPREIKQPSEDVIEMLLFDKKDDVKTESQMPAGSSYAELLSVYIEDVKTEE